MYPNVDWQMMRQVCEFVDDCIFDAIQKHRISFAAFAFPLTFGIYMLVGFIVGHIPDDGVMMMAMLMVMYNCTICLWTCCVVVQLYKLLELNMHMHNTRSMLYHNPQ